MLWVAFYWYGMGALVILEVAMHLNIINIG